MKNEIYNKKLSFVDATNAVYSIDIKISLEDGVTRRYDTLEEIDSQKRLSISGSYSCSCGQIYDHIKPRTEGQRLLVDFWKKYHLNDCIPGTKKQMDYLEGGRYDEDYQKVFSCINEILDAHDITKEQLSKLSQLDSFNGEILVTLENRLIRLFGGSIYHERYFFTELGEAYCGLRKVGINLYLMLDVLTTPSMKTDYCVMRAFLAGRGLLKDGEYIYGTSWLYKPLDEEELGRIIYMIEQEEAERKADCLADLKESYKNNKETRDENESEDEDDEEEDEDDEEEEEDDEEEEEEKLPDLNTDSEELLNLVMNEKDCDEIDAKRIIALMRAKDIDIEDLWNIDIDDDTQISYGRINYYVADRVDLENIARDLLLDQRELWVEAVKADQTDKGLDEWVDDVIDNDGIGNTLGGYDGNEYEEEVMGVTFTIIRQ